MGKCYSVKRESKYMEWRTYDFNTPPIFNYVTDRHKVTHQEKCDFLISLKNDPEEEVVRQIKANPNLLSCVFWFEYYKTGSNSKEELCCTCSRELELCYKKGIPSGEMIKRLELSIITTCCPHVALAKAGRTDVSCKQDISSSEVSRTCDCSPPLSIARNNKKETAGVYWVHLAAIYDKMKIINQVFPFAIECGICNNNIKTSRHHFSPIDVALAHRKFQIAVSIATFDPRIIEFITPKNVPADFYSEPLKRTLELNQLETFKELFEIARSCSCVCYRCHQEWPKWVFSYFQDGNMETINVLLSIKSIPLHYYADLFNMVHEIGSYWMCDTIIAESDIRTQMSHATPKDIREFDNAMIRAVLSNEAQVVKLFTEIGFNKNVEINKTSILVWAEFLEFNDIARVLRTAKAKVKVRSCRHSILYQLIEANLYNFYEIDDLSLVHRVYQIKNKEYLKGTMATDVAYLAWSMCRHGVFHYLLLQGADANIETYCDYFRHAIPLVYHLMCSNTFVDGYKLLELFSRHDIVTLTSIDELCLGLNSTTWEKSKSRDRDTLYDFDDLWQKWYKPVRPLSTLCRWALKKHYKRHFYYRFLETKINDLPRPIMKYLTMSELLSKIWNHPTPVIIKGIEQARKCLSLDPRLFDD